MASMCFKCTARIALKEWAFQFGCDFINSVGQMNRLAVERLTNCVFFLNFAQINIRHVHIYSFACGRNQSNDRRTNTKNGFFWKFSLYLGEITFGLLLKSTGVSERPVAFVQKRWNRTKIAEVSVCLWKNVRTSGFDYCNDIIRTDFDIFHGYLWRCPFSCDSNVQCRKIDMKLKALRCFL